MLISISNLLWSIDITYCRMKHGFMYMTAIIDWHSTYIVGYTLSNTLGKASVQECIKKAIKIHGTPKIINCDQGLQFTNNSYPSIVPLTNTLFSIDFFTVWIKVYLSPPSSITLRVSLIVSIYGIVILLEKTFLN